MIYGRMGGEVEVLRYATEDDVRRLDPPLDKEARTNLANRSWVVIKFLNGKIDGVERITHLGYLRADGGISEILDALGRQPATRDIPLPTPAARGPQG